MTTQQPTDIIADFGLDLLPEEERNELLSDLGEVIFMGAMHKAWNALTIPKQDELTALFTASNEDPENEEKRNAIDAFLKENVPDWDHYIAQEVEALKSTQEQISGELTS